LEEFTQIWNDYEGRKSIEAKIVKDADNLDVDLELKEQEAKGVTLGKAFLAHRKALSTGLYTKTARKFWQQIQKSNPHDWHLNAPNRFTAGDWKKYNKKKRKK
jgi:5'-deoxynucleotidase YfbR-like HD superfamily hydrolase